ncbi:MAG: hypothetical protein RLZZ519_287 [Bacteroidota bacterium]|jgi:beta-mannosidase
MRKRRASIALFFGLMAWSVGVFGQATEQISLDGAWQFREEDSLEWLPAMVPGTVHTDLLASKRIPDPYIGLNEKAVQWIEERNWEYRKTFFLSPSQVQNAQSEFVFEGLDTYCDVFLNGKLLGHCDNMHRRWVFDGKKDLKTGENELVLKFFSPMKRVMPAVLASLFVLSSGNDASPTKVSPYVRKAAYHFGWDFGPRMVTAGIWRPVTLILWKQAKIAAVSTQPVRLKREVAKVRSRVDVDVAIAGKYELTLLLDGKALASAQRTLKPGLQTFELNYAIAQPRYWWPVGMGKPELYQVEARLKRGNEEVDSFQQNTGLRTIRLVQEKDEIGTSFYFSVNDFLEEGGPLFIKGANYVPADAFLPRGAEKQIQLLEAAKAVGMNMIRVWGGGVYADEGFYEWCDANGMLVWQDLAFACMMYPLEGKFLENAKLEFTDNALRLRNHPSLALWCGNNEIDVAWHNWGWQQEFKYSEEFVAKLWKEYVAFFQESVPSILQKVDPKGAYISTSPLSNWGKEENFNHHNMHYWGVWHGTDSLDGFSHYVPRFMSEYGFQSWPSETTLRGYIDSADWNIDSAAIRNRQKSYKGNAPILKFLRPLYGEPKDFSAFLTLSQLLQRDAMTPAIEAHRMKSPHCMGTLYWQLGDCWPGASWSTIDFDGVWKPAHYALKRLYAPCLIGAQSKNDSLFVRIAPDAAVPFVKVTVEMRTLDDSSIVEHICAPYLHQGINEFAYRLRDFESQPIDLRNTKAVIKVFDGKKAIQDNEPIARHVVYFVAPKELNLRKTSPEFTLQQDGEVFRISLRSKQLIKDLQLSIANTQASFSDNFFDLSPDSPRTIEIVAPGVKTVSELEGLLRFSDLYSLMH